MGPSLSIIRLHRKFVSLYMAKFFTLTNRGMTSRIAPISQTENGKEMQKKLWDETIVELTNVDMAVADVLGQ
jgi:hypothetical protein